MIKKPSIPVTGAAAALILAVLNTSPVSATSESAATPANGGEQAPGVSSTEVSVEPYPGSGASGRPELPDEPALVVEVPGPVPAPPMPGTPPAPSPSPKDPQKTAVPVPVQPTMVPPGGEPMQPTQMPADPQETESKGREAQDEPRAAAAPSEEVTARELRAQHLERIRQERARRLEAMRARAAERAQRAAETSERLQAPSFPSFEGYDEFGEGLGVTPDEREELLGERYQALRERAMRRREEAMAKWESYWEILEAMTPEQKEAIQAIFGSGRKGRQAPGCGRMGGGMPMPPPAEVPQFGMPSGMGFPGYGYGPRVEAPPFDWGRNLRPDMPWVGGQSMYPGLRQPWFGGERAFQGPPPGRDYWQP